MFAIDILTDTLRHPKPNLKTYFSLKCPLITHLTYKLAVSSLSHSI